ncbi:hypothetical protein GGS24DRAFT_499335 [Hypoxylon argillaceum]|nr:hypothetical protein GGS24DRAFT_499335 [Hypoxylon argillaceum]
MENIADLFTEIDNIEVNNQNSTINITTENRIVTAESLPPEVWLEISKNLDSFGDIYRLSRVNKLLYSLLIFTRAEHEAKVFSGSSIGDKPPTMLHIALKFNWALSEIQSIVRGYIRAGGDLLENDYYTNWEPPLHAAVRKNRLDVIELLLDSGVNINLRWGGIWDRCYTKAHLNCVEGVDNDYCRNALRVARVTRNSEMEEYLLRRGIEDRDPVRPDVDTGACRWSDWYNLEGIQDMATWH